MWLGTHGMEIGAISVMMYCFREREQLLNLNEMLAGFRMFPSYIRIGGLREDLPRGFHEAVKEFLDKFPGQARRVRQAPHEEPGLDQAHEGRRQAVDAKTRWRWASSGPMARAVGIPYDVRKTFPYLKYETFDFIVPTHDRRRRLRAVPREDGGDAAEREASASRRSSASRRPASTTAATTAIVPPPKDRVYTEMEALIQHFLLYSQGFNVPKGECYVPVEGPRGEHGFYIVSDGTQPPGAREVARAVVHRLPGAAEDDRRRADRGRHRGDRIDGRRHGRCGSMTARGRASGASAGARGERGWGPGD